MRGRLFAPVFVRTAVDSEGSMGITMTTASRLMWNGSAVPVMADDTESTLMQVDRSLAEKTWESLARTPAAPEGETVRADG